MRALGLDAGSGARKRLRILAIGAHCDDIDIGCGGATLALLERYEADVTWLVLSANSAREREFRQSARRFLRRARSSKVMTHGFRDGFFPSQYSSIKDTFESLKKEMARQGDFQIRVVRLEVGGFCKRCRRTEASDRDIIFNLLLRHSRNTLCLASVIRQPKKAVPTRNLLAKGRDALAAFPLALTEDYDDT